MAKLILLRHGQSTYNLENRFTGVLDVGLSEAGIGEAKEAAKRLSGEKIDRIFTSVLARAIDTARIIIEMNGLGAVPITRDQALNERHYGDLQGLNKDETRQKFGVEQVHRWRRSYDEAPPNGESLKDTCDRVIPYFKKEILPRLQKGENVLVVAHGNSLRGLIKELEQLSDDEIVQVEIPTGIPIFYEVKNDLFSTDRH